MVPFESFDHVQLAMPEGEEAAAREFYVRLLGMTELEKPADLQARGGVWFASGTLQLHLGVDRPFVPAKKAHPALRCSDLSSLCARLERSGTAIVRGGTFEDGLTHCYVDDPFGNRLELVGTLVLAPSDPARAEWERRVAMLWTSVDDTDPDTFVREIDALVSELPPDDASGLFERACAFDSTGHSDLAAPLYAKALETGLSGVRRRRAVIQMSSSMRNLGQAQAAADLLSAELEREPDALTGAVRAVLALALTDLHREREAVSVALTALAEYLPRYNRSMARYASELVDGEVGRS